MISLTLQLNIDDNLFSKRAMKKIFTWTAVLCLALTACKQSKTTDRQPATFRQTTQQSSSTQQSQQSQNTVPPLREGDRGRLPQSEGDRGRLSLDLLKQRVPRGTSEIMLTRTSYITSYNKNTRTPNWVAWTLTKDHTYGQNLRENERFEEDFDVPTPRATFQDFYNSRYDRGHMCPAGDNKWDEKAMTETFLLTNICPQNHGLNKEDWNDLEMQCRSWARRFGEITIVCGPLFEDAENQRTIGRNKISVPSGFFKVVYRARPTPLAIGFIFRNDGSNQPWRQQRCTVDEVEQRSGINFFHMLPDDVEDEVEAEEDIDDWFQRR